MVAENKHPLIASLENQPNWEDRYKFPKQEGRAKRTVRRFMERFGFSPDVVDEGMTFMFTGATAEESALIDPDLTPERLTEIKERITERRDRASTLRHPRRLSPQELESEEAQQIAEMRLLVERYDRRQAGTQAVQEQRRRMGSGRLGVSPLKRSEEEMQGRADQS